MKQLYAVFADYRFCGLYRSKAAANRLVNELNQLSVSWYPKPTVKKVHDEFTEEEFLAFDWGMRTAYWTCLNAIECRYFGRAKNVIG